MQDFIQAAKIHTNYIFETKIVKIEIKKGNKWKHSKLVLMIWG